MPFNSSGLNMFLAWVGFICFVSFLATVIIFLDSWFRFKLKNRKPKKKNPIKEVREILKQKV